MSNAHEADNHAKEQAQVQLNFICAMVAALEVDYDRLTELRGYADGDLTDDDRDELDRLEQAANDCESYDDAQQRIFEAPLSVQVRSGWHNPGEKLEPAEFEILLCTGGPAVRIIGELDEHNQPDRAWIEYQDWFTPWKQFHGDDHDSAALLTYCQQFYFGE